jgi:ABC-type molybdate transport system substrate-binding protein
MKKILILAAITGLLCGCAGNSSQKKSQQAKQNELGIVDSHNARYSLDYEGIYTGKMKTTWYKK